MINKTPLKLYALKINISTLDPEISHFSQNRFNCNSSIDSDKSKFIPLKQLLASLVKSNINLDDNLEFINKSYIYKLLYLLTSYFKIEDDHSNYINKSSEKIIGILNYVNENFEKKLSVDDLANSLYISNSYISKLFKRFIGLSFGEYLIEVRLSYAVRDLSNPNLKIEYIAEKNDSSNTRSFVTSFKNKYNFLPSVFRKTLCNNQSFTIYFN